jgi:hypothetical protein
VKELEEKGVPVVLIPTHKSHIDYIVMSIICFHYNLPLPYIAAGDNLNIPIVGYLFRCVTHACPSVIPRFSFPVLVLFDLAWLLLVATTGEQERSSFAGSLPATRSTRCSSAAMWSRSSTNVLYPLPDPAVSLILHITNKRACEWWLAASVLEFFIEGGRSRSGKVLRPKMGMLSVITNTVLEGQVDDAMVVPVAISYDKVSPSSLLPTPSF